MVTYGTLAERSALRVITIPKEAAMIKSVIKLCAFFFVLVVSPSVFAQQMTAVPFNANYWDLGGVQSAVVNYMGKESIRVGLLGAITVPNVEFLDGTIEVDINFPEEPLFPGIIFRAQDEGNYEEFYIRPHQSGNPDAIQYTPVFNGNGGWQLYYGEGYSQAVELEPNTWHHIKINVLGDQADVYFDDMDTPILKITDLKREPTAGRIGLIGINTSAYFANFSYTTAKPTLALRPETNGSALPSLITSWDISNLVRDEAFQGKAELDENNLTWTRHDTEQDGTINLGRFAQRTPGMNTILAKINIRAEESGIKQLDFGYSDFVWVYVNGKLVYSGRDSFMSRDYRFLGTIGYFDTIYADLEAGDNEIHFVVSETFGGWGIKARFTDPQGLEIE
jgi:hypothetical protein